ncbi:MAG: guanylate kinase [Chloroflexi bacterium]|nr:guanylate kinase [Chloroflexota bacterium]
MTASDLWVTQFYQRIQQPPALFIVISGPSGVGKTALLRRMREMGAPLHFVITATSRAPRPGEVNGADYHFVSPARFEEMIADHELLEHAVVYGEYKGIPRRQVEEALASGRDVIVSLDVQGAHTIRQLAPGALLIFLTAGSEAELTQRLQGRATEDPEALARRLATAHAELQRADEFDYVVLNGEGCLDRAVEQVRCILQAEKCRVDARRVVLGQPAAALVEEGEDDAQGAV